MKRAIAIIGLLISLICVSCRQQSIRSAIETQLQMYPASRVQDIYKSFCQDNLGPGHLIPNSEAAKAYLQQELETYRKDVSDGRYGKPAERYVPVGDKGNYVRVDLSVVLDSIKTEETLLNAFVRSANEGRTISTEKWKKKWKGIAEVLRNDFPNIPEAEKDLAAIDSLMAKGQFILHHSSVFNDTYHPHYRIIAKELL